MQPRPHYWVGSLLESCAETSIHPAHQVSTHQRPVTAIDKPVVLCHWFTRRTKGFFQKILLNCLDSIGLVAIPHQTCCDVIAQAIRPPVIASLRAQEARTVFVELR